MNRFLKTLSVASVAMPLALLGATANAAIILDQSNFTLPDYTLPADTDPNADSVVDHDGEFAEATVRFGQLQSTGGFLLFEYLYKEAGATNTLVLTAGNQVIFDTSTSTAGATSGLISVGSGYLPFGLCSSISSFGTYGNCIYNDVAASLTEQAAGPSGTDTSYRSMAFLQDPQDALSWIIFFDDSGANNNNDFDDMVVRVTYKAVPEPGALVLLGLGLIGIGISRRRSAS